MEDRRPAQPADQDSRHAGRAARDHGGPGRGISVNVTLIFSVERHRAVMDAYLAGLEAALKAGTISTTSSRSPRSSCPGWTPRSTSDWRRSAPKRHLALRGRAGWPTRGLAYAAYEDVFNSKRWVPLAEEGAWVQRPCGRPPESRTRVLRHPLRHRIGRPDTVNTMPEKTLEAVAEHGVVTGTPSPERPSPPRRCSTSWRRRHRPGRRVPRSSRMKAWRSSKSWRELLEATQTTLDAASK